MSTPVTELKTTLFKTPIISPLLGLLARLIMKLTGWRIADEPPLHHKCVLIGAPHTSNWDFALFVLMAFIKKQDVHWMGKASLFPFPFKRLVIWLGGIPIDRNKTNNLVDQMVDYYASVDRLTVLIAPEGTRAKVERWKSGFYHVACKVEIPIVLGYVDAKNKTVGFGPDFIPTGDFDADIKKIQAFYADKQAINPQNY